jgi:hypothetical protein
MSCEYHEESIISRSANSGILVLESVEQVESLFMRPTNTMTGIVVPIQELVDSSHCKGVFNVSEDCTVSFKVE